MFNNNVREICAETGAYLIDIYQSFVYGDGSRVRHYFFQDGVHLNMYGSRALVTTINRHISIIKRKDQSHSRANMKQSTYTGTSGDNRMQTGNQINTGQRYQTGRRMVPSVGRRSLGWTNDMNDVNSTGSAWTNSY